LLWSRLRDRQLGGFKFRRQAPVGGRIVDFLCPEKRLAIELDGSGHGYSAGERRDRKRAIQLEKHGLRIIRFWNPQVLRDLEWVLDQIARSGEVALSQSNWLFRRINSLGRFVCPHCRAARVRLSHRREESRSPVWIDGSAFLNPRIRL
jgi:very-short-patch-repair endonuclease